MKNPILIVELQASFMMGPDGLVSFPAMNGKYKLYLFYLFYLDLGFVVVGKDFPKLKLLGVTQGYYEGQNPEFGFRKIMGGGRIFKATLF